MSLQSRIIYQRQDFSIQKTEVPLYEKKAKKAAAKSYKSNKAEPSLPEPIVYRQIQPQIIDPGKQGTHGRDLEADSHQAKRQCELLQTLEFLGQGRGTGRHTIVDIFQNPQNRQKGKTHRDAEDAPRCVRSFV
jgi:hypothetical protein